LAPIAARIAASRAPHSGSHFKMPADQELWGFQKASLDYLLSGTGQGLIADEPGLGKTPQAIVYANEIGAKRVLVICPAAIRTQWARKIDEWSVMPPPRLIYPVFSAKNGVHPTAQWVILSYALARNAGIVAALAKQRFDLVIMDESHYLKDVDSQQTRAIFGQADGLYHPKGIDPIPAIVSRAAHVLCLSGTPIVNRPNEAYTTTRALAWDAIDYASFDKFRVRYNPQKETVLRGGKRIKEERIGRVIELGNRMRGTFMARHAKREVMTQLKFPRYEVVQYEETKELRRLIEAESLLGIDVDAVQTTTDYEMLGHIATLRKDIGVATAPQAADYVRTLLDGGIDKIVVFGWHIEVLNILQHKLMRYGVVRIDGSTSGKARQAGIDAFVTAPNVRVILGNIQSMGTGVDGLQRVCQRCVLVEPSWTPGDNQQAIDRLDRGGQLGSVQADFLVPAGSVIEKILVAALRKAKIIHETLK
jgi:SWI/SNF-related matrix-associated actin-dependent regulator 1 of chromatin subfamily A